MLLVVTVISVFKWGSFTPAVPSQCFVLIKHSDLALVELQVGRICLWNTSLASPRSVGQTGYYWTYLTPDACKATNPSVVSVASLGLHFRWQMSSAKPGSILQKMWEDRRFTTGGRKNTLCVLLPSLHHLRDPPSTWHVKHSTNIKMQNPNTWKTSLRWSITLNACQHGTDCLLGIRWEHRFLHHQPTKNKMSVAYHDQMWTMWSKHQLDHINCSDFTSCVTRSSQQSK